MAFFRVHWDPRIELDLVDELIVRHSVDACHIQEGDWIYIVAESPRPALLAKLEVSRSNADESRGRLKVYLSTSGSTYFSRIGGQPLPQGILEQAELAHREVTVLSEESADVLLSICETTNDFSLREPPPMWPGVTRKIELITARALRDGDPRPGIEIALDFLRSNYATSELPGPSPVYVNAARRAFQAVPPTIGTSVARRPHSVQVTRRRGPLTDEAIRKGINDDLSLFVTTSPDSRRHQDILKQLRDRLIELGVEPEYDGFVDCIVASEAADVYFEVKSASEITFRHQLRLGIGQLLDYIWHGQRSADRCIRGFLVIEDVGAPESFKEFVRSVSLKVCWDTEIPNLRASDLEVW